jgi:hypothetical protein
MNVVNEPSSEEKVSVNAKSKRATKQPALTGAAEGVEVDGHDVDVPDVVLRHGGPQPQTPMLWSGTLVITGVRYHILGGRYQALGVR